MNGHSIADVDEALSIALAGFTTSASEAVTVFVEAPGTSAQRTRKFPSVVVIQNGAPTLDASREEADTGDYIDSYDDENDPTEATVYQTGEPYKLSYTVETFARTSTTQSGAAMDRELQAFVLSRLPPKGSLTIGEDEDVVSCFLVGANDLNEVRNEITVYHRVFSYEVLVVLGSQTATTELVARTMELDFYQAAQNADGEISADSSDNTLDRTLQITNDGAGPL